jgi:type-F conjugative transfer system pilin assembly protein TrbC
MCCGGSGIAVLCKKYFFTLLIFSTLFFATDIFAQNEDAEKIVEAAQKIQDDARKSNNKNVNEVLRSVEKARNSAEYQKQQNWINENRNEILAKQAKPLPKVDYDITEKEREKDAIAKLLNQYRINPDQTKSNPIINKYPLMIFVSSSIPKSALKDLMVQAHQAGGVLVFRGIIGTLRNTQQFLTSLSKENVSAIIDPRLFNIFNVTSVPTFVVLGKSVKNCDEKNCNFTPLHDRVSGNITLNYALEEMANGNGEAKSEAAAILAKYSGGRK